MGRARMERHLQSVYLACRLLHCSQEGPAQRAAHPTSTRASGQAHSTHSELEEQAAVPVRGLLGDLDGFPQQRLCCVHGILKGDSHV